MVAVSGALLLAVGILALITYYRKWTHLWKEWLTRLDHKKIGIMYIVLAPVMLLRGFADAMAIFVLSVMMAIDFTVPATAKKKENLSMGLSMIDRWDINSCRVYSGSINIRLAFPLPYSAACLDKPLHPIGRFE